MPIRHTFAAKQVGFSMIEVMVAVLLLSIGLIGYSTLQVRAVKATQSSLQRTAASVLASNIIESMRINKSIAVNPPYPYNIANICSPPAPDGTLAQSDLNAWFLSLQNALGNAESTCADITCANVSSGAPGTCTVNIFWDDSRALGGQSKQTIQLVGRL
jgi:type IV pilus assembly protein PilV